MVYARKGCEESSLFKEVLKNLSNIELVENFFTPKDNKSNILLLKEEDNFVHICPGMKRENSFILNRDLKKDNIRCCNYYVADLVKGCPFDCEYCILQFYLPHKYITVNCNIEKLILSLKEHNRLGASLRVGSGELSDSLALDKIIPLTKFIIPTVNTLENIRFEFKTKSVVIDNLFTLNPKNIIITWSINGLNIAKDVEHGAAPIIQRIEAAKQVAEYGYKIGFHFDPLLMVDNFEKEYNELLKLLFDNIRQKSIAYISISSFRCPEELRYKMRLRGDKSSILRSDLILAEDNKLRYFKADRIAMLSHVYNALKKEWKDTAIYFCMEHVSLWEEIAGFDPGDNISFERIFK